MSRNNLIQFRRGTASQFASVNPVLQSGEPGFATDSYILKIGDGVTPWTGLSALSGFGINSLLDDGTPQLGGNLDINGRNINGSGNISITGDLDVDGVGTFNRVGIGTDGPTHGFQVEQNNIVFNDGGGDYNFRVESNNDANLLFTDGGTDRIGIGNNSPTSKLDVSGIVTASGYIVPSQSGFLKANGTVDNSVYITGHHSVNAASSVDNSGRTYIQDILLDSFGHITGITSSTETAEGIFVTGITYNSGDHSLVLLRNSGTVTGILNGVAHSGDNISIFVNDTGYITEHPSVSAASSSDNTGLIYIQDILLDQYGHITGIATASGTTTIRGVVNINDNITSGINISEGYDVGSIDIFLNGVKLVDGTDFTATDGSGVSFTSTPASGSVVQYLTLVGAQSTHINVSASSDVDNSGNYFIQDLLFDQYGHVTGVESVLVTGAVAGDETDPIFTGSVAYNISSSDTGNWNSAYSWVSGNSGIVISSGDNISLLNNNLGFITGHPSVSAASSSDNSDRTYIQDILLDSFGHVTGISTATETGAGGTTYTAGTGLTLDGSNEFHITGVNTSLLVGTITNAQLSGSIANNKLSNSAVTINAGTGLTNGGSVSLGGSVNIDIDSTILTTGTLDTKLQGGTGINLIYDSGNSALEININNSVVQTGDNISVLNNNLGYITGHPSVSAASSSDNSNQVFIQDLLLDSFGHVTGISTATATGAGGGGSVTHSGVMSIVSTGIVAGQGINTSYNSGTQELTISSNNALLFYLT